MDRLIENMEGLLIVKILYYTIVLNIQIILVLVIGYPFQCLLTLDALILERIRDSECVWEKYQLVHFYSIKGCQSLVICPRQYVRAQYFVRSSNST
jgi:hypothetical protein